jgi:hypothetical protein
VKCLKKLEHENSRRKRLYAELSDEAEGPFCSAGLSSGRMGRPTYYRPRVDWGRSDMPLIAALTTLSAAKSRWGFWKYMDRLRLDGHRWNHKRLWRVYCRLGLNLLSQTKKRLSVHTR